MTKKNKCEGEQAIEIATTLYFAIDVYTPGLFKIGMNLSDLEVVEASKLSGTIAFDGNLFTDAASKLLSNLVSAVNNKY